MTFKDWIDAVVSAWPILVAIGTAGVGFLLGNDRSKRKLEETAKGLADLSLAFTNYQAAVKKDADGIGGKVSALASEAGLAKQKCDRAKEDHERLERDWRAFRETTYPADLKDTRHEVIKHIDATIIGINDRHEALRDDVRDIRRDMK